MRAALVGRRLLTALPLALGIVLITFLLLRLMPGDPVDIMMGQGGSVSAGEIAGLRRQLGLNRPLLQQLGHFTARLAVGDLGASIRDQTPVTSLLASTLPATVELAVAAVLLSLLVAVPIGVFSAVRPRGLVDRVAMTGAFFGISMPAFWLGLVLIVLFSVGLHWLPTSGRLDPSLGVPAHTGIMLIDTPAMRPPSATPCATWCCPPSPWAPSSPPCSRGWCARA